MCAQTVSERLSGERAEHAEALRQRGTSIQVLLALGASPNDEQC